MRWKIRNRKKWKEEAVSPVIATILMVAITVVLAAVLYLMITVLITPVPPPIKTTLGNPEPESDNKYSIMVTSAPDKEPLQQFSVKLYEDEVVVGTLDPLSDNSSDGKILKFSDRDGAGTMTAGDLFVIQTELNHKYELVIFHGDVLAGERDWST